MRYRRIAAVSLNQIPFAWDHNQRNIMDALTHARDKKCTYVCTPELSVTGYDCADNFARLHLQRTAWKIASEIAAETNGWGLVYNLGLPVTHRGHLHNCSVMVADGKMVGLPAKRDLAGDGNYYEPRHFKPWPKSKVDRIYIGGLDLPIGDIFFRLGNPEQGYEELGLETCEEAWKHDRIAAFLKACGVRIIYNSSGSHYSRGKYSTRHGLLLDGSRAADAIVAFANENGCNGRLIMDGGPAVYESGNLRARGERFSFKGYEIAFADCDLDLRTVSRISTASFEPSSKPFPLEQEVVVDFQFSEIKADERQPDSFFPAVWEDGPNHDVEEICRAEALAFRDWITKAKRRGVALPLSGGRDSALVACYMRLMVELGVQQLGFEAFRAQFDHIPGFSGCATLDDMMHRLLYCFYQPADRIVLPGEKKAGRISGKQTENAAKAVARAVGARYSRFPIGKVASLVLAIAFKEIGKELGRPFNWEDDRNTLQNLQARVRAVFAWLVTNIWHLLLITTSNRTEGAVGYWTAGGDGEGGLAPNFGSSKDFICQVLEVLHKQGLLGIQAMRVLVAVLGVPATAELLPAEMNQTDEGELAPFPVLAAIEDHALAYKRSPLECLLELQATTTMKQYTLQQLAQWVEKWFTLWTNSPWKREQTAVGLHTERHNVDPRSGYRHAILNGGFERELKEMWTYVRETEKQQTVQSSSRD